MTTWAYNATRTRNEASNIVEDVESIALLGIMQEAVGSDAFTSRADWVYAYGKTSATVLTVTLSRTNGNPYDVTVTIDTSAKTVDVEVDDNGTITNTSASDTACGSVA